MANAGMPPEGGPSQESPLVTHLFQVSSHLGSGDVVLVAGVDALVDAMRVYCTAQVEPGSHLAIDFQGVRDIEFNAAAPLAQFLYTFREGTAYTYKPSQGTPGTEASLAEPNYFSLINLRGEARATLDATITTGNFRQKLTVIAPLQEEDDHFNTLLGRHKLGAFPQSISKRALTYAALWHSNQASRAPDLAPVVRQRDATKTGQISGDLSYLYNLRLIARIKFSYYHSLKVISQPGS